MKIKLFDFQQNAGNNIIEELYYGCFVQHVSTVH